jgi:predicted metal-binding membrane protein
MVFAHRSYFLPILGSLVVLACATLWIWEQSPYGRYLNHSELGSIGLDSDAKSLLSQIGMYVAGWTLMTIAMMLPTTVPLLHIFRRLSGQRADANKLLWLVITGYLTVWLGFGVTAHLFDLGLHKLYDRNDWLQANPWVFGAGPLLIAGAFQFSRLKYSCLDKCRSPLSFVMQYWRGRREQWHSFLLGAHHGVFCIGCCWALMLLMFAVGMGSVGWMLALACVMAIEKNMPWGSKMSAPLGIGLLAWGGLVVFNHTYTWQG